MIKQKSTDLVKELIAHLTLVAMTGAEISRHQFNFFTIQKAILTADFPSFILSCIKNVEPLHNKALNAALMSNYLDEIGASSDGFCSEDQSHSQWKSNYHNALNLSQDDVNAVPALPQTAQYSDKFLSFCNKGSVLQQVGAFLMLERLIPLEYRAIKNSRDAIYPETFVITDADTDVVKHAKQKACLYIDGHIQHDAQYHFPALLKSLECYEQSADQLAEIVSGMEFMARLKADFYDGIAEHWKLGSLAA